jgi:hypothetical protein
MANILKTSKRVAIVSALVKGNSIQAASRMVGCSKNTTTKLLMDLGEACSKYQDEALRNLPCHRLEVGETWAFIDTAQNTANRTSTDQDGGKGDVWTFSAIDAETKLVLAWLIGPRSRGMGFCQDLASRLDSPSTQLSANSQQILPNGFSKKVENLAHAVAIHFMVYNFAKPHETLTKAADGIPTTPAMAAGVASKPWSLRDVIGLLRSN